MSRRNGFVALMGVALVGVVGYMAVYLPRYSPEAEAARRRTAAMRGGQGAEQPKDLAPGSVWKQMTKQREYLASLSQHKEEEGGAAASKAEVK